MVGLGCMQVLRLHEEEELKVNSLYTEYRYTIMVEMHPYCSIRIYVFDNAFFPHCILVIQQCTSVDPVPQEVSRVGSTVRDSCMCCV